MKDMDVRVLRFGALIGLLAAMAACKDTASEPSPSPARNEVGPVTEKEPMQVEAPMNLQRQTKIAIDDLARRLNVPPEQVVLSGARQVTWRSGALGCPEPGMSYTEALVPGAVIYLQAGKTIHAYHARFAGEPFYCPRERVEPPAHEEGLDLT